ncbi:type 2 isopentenyl-diphosphate Delta-isomerase [Rickettsia endosymbiont of Cardiosporidium cionae]|uniref:type 2 isopentenyl-diphosphate Delta-isomerase n=1 Tax=Rickettsia endosymbiont of Cardiosporidium cionae TaxID=2777155 RepID=UPI0018940CE3|nr:type 2 isopentenyl-diphosphate Delta-isomerase [Rickettsia endosymbiont of Cardiosporidium cionae]KAF8818445.1 type 2 isopentenyl-diphosphate Delta-isomerase [Rickettsia endosymbiont of Cardiosporidium cionae]
MPSIFDKKKLEHVSIVNNNNNIDKCCNYFDHIRLIHRALPELSLKEIDPSVSFLGYKLSFPLIISPITGGSSSSLKKINYNLAKAASITQIAMSVGSQRIMFHDTLATESFDLRKLAPNIPLISNIGAVQLNYELEKKHISKAIDLLKADAIYLHLNPLQEAIQEEGNTNFSNLASKIGEVVSSLAVPVILKEVGSGMSNTDIEIGLNHGIKYFDIAGSGGTSWSRVEHERISIKEKVKNNISDIGITFENWGIPTYIALKNCSIYHDKAVFISSGGIRNGIDIAKSIILGASLCGIANVFLKKAMISVDAVVKEIEKIKQEFVLAMFLLGIKNVNSLFLNKSLILSS